MNHTPGPWELHQEILESTGMRNSVNVCVPDRTTPRGCRGVAEAEILGMSRMEAEANARLIAAAPELLEACKALLAATCSDPPICKRPACCMAKVAIAKAEGGS